MDRSSQDLQAERLRQILFPKKVRASRLSIDTSLGCLKENHELNRTFSIKQQIYKLKQGIQTFVERQPFTQNVFATPRECLELIKCMSDKLSNYCEQIQQAVNTLIESIPKPLPNLMPSSKYFIMGLKFSYFSSVVQVNRCRMLGEAFSELKSQYYAQMELKQRLEAIRKFQIQHLQRSKSRKLAYGFNKWRNTCDRQRKKEQETYEHDRCITKSMSLLSILTSESQMVLWLQKNIQTNASAVEILLYNPQSSTIRSYKYETQVLASVFESVQSQSQISTPHSGDQISENKIKRLEIPLQDSLTKVCLSKRRTVVVEQLKKDLDYSPVDDFSILQGLTSREVYGGCIFTPIVWQGEAIGILREYFYGKVGQAQHSSTIGQIAQILGNAIKASNLFQNVKSKNSIIRNHYYLKSVLLLNYLENQPLIDEPKEEEFFRMLENDFGVKFQSQINYEVALSLEKTPKFTLSGCKDNPLHAQKLVEVMTALSKMWQCQVNHINEQQRVYFKTESTLYTFQVVGGKNSEGILPAEIIGSLLNRKQVIQQKKQQELRNYMLEKQANKKVQQQIRLQKQKKLIVEFFSQQRAVKNWAELTLVVKEYLSKFVDVHHRYELEQISKVSKTTPVPVKSVLLYQKPELQIILRPKDQAPGCVYIAEMYLDGLKNLCQSYVNKIAKPLQIAFDEGRLVNISEALYSPNIRQSIMELLCHYLCCPVQQVKQIPINPQKIQDKQTFYCNVETKLLQSNMPIERILKDCRNKQQISLEQMSTVLCLGGQFIIAIDKNYRLGKQLVHKLAQIFANWVTQVSTRENMESVTARQERSCKFVKTIQEFYQLRQRTLLNQIRAFRPRVRNIPNCLAAFVRRQNTRLLKLAMNRLRGLLETPSQIYYAEKLVKLQTMINKFYRASHANQLFGIFRESCSRQKRMNRIAEVITGKIRQNLTSAFLEIGLRQYVRNPQSLDIFHRIVIRQSNEVFEKIKRLCRERQVISSAAKQTECSFLSKMTSLSSIAYVLHQKFPQAQVELYLKNGFYVRLADSSVEVTDSLSRKCQGQRIEFICEGASLIRYVVWCLPGLNVVSLEEKHYLKAVSKAIEESYAKHIYTNEQFLASINHFITKKAYSYMQKSLGKLRKFAMNSIKAQQYELRNSYYESNMQVENYKLMQKQQEKQHEQQAVEKTQALEGKQELETKLIEYRKDIVRLAICSTRLEEKQVQMRVQCQINESKRLFDRWRLTATYCKKYSHRRELARKRQAFTCCNMIRIIQEKMKENYESSLRMIMVQVAEKKAISLSADKKILQRKDFNRLMTFQDELNQFTIERSTERTPQQPKANDSKQISVIPISFKHFEESKKQNYDVTDQQAKKMNEGAYKLNSKTLKFLKRMGKITQ